MTDRSVRGTIRGLVQEILSEGVKDTHGYKVRSLNDIEFDNSKANLPILPEDNPFILGSDAYNHWYNDGEMYKRFMKDTEVIRHNPSLRPSTWVERDRKPMGARVEFKVGSQVIVPTLYNEAKDGSFLGIGEITSIDEIPIGKPGERRWAHVAVVQWPPGAWRFGKEQSQGAGTPLKRPVGVAFLHLLGGPVVARNNPDIISSRLFDKMAEYRSEKGTGYIMDIGSRRSAERKLIRRPGKKPEPTAPTPAPPTLSPSTPAKLTPEEVIRKFKDQGPEVWSQFSSDFFDMATGGDADGLRQSQYPGWSDDDFQHVLETLEDHFQG